MLYSILLVALLTVYGFYSLSNLYIHKMKDMSSQHGPIDPVTNRFVSTAGDYSSVGGYEDASSTEAKYNKDKIEIVAIRTCRSVSTQAHSNGCSNWMQPSSMWAFLGAAGSTGSIDQVYTLSSSSVLAANCSNADAYGRYLFKMALPSSLIVGKGYKYDLSSINNNFVDACAYTEIIKK